jgi:hypothetical protein
MMPDPHQPKENALEDTIAGDRQQHCLDAILNAAHGVPLHRGNDAL